MFRVSFKLIKLFVTIKLQVIPIIPIIEGGSNEWLEPLIFEFGKPMSLPCDVTRKTSAVSWWVVGIDRSPRKISTDVILTFTSAHHGHSGIYECFLIFENNRFLKRSRKVLVVEMNCSKHVCTSDNNSTNLFTKWSLRFNTYPVDNIHFGCDGTRNHGTISSIGMPLKVMNFVSSDFTNCSYGIENSESHSAICLTNEIIDGQECNQSCFLKAEPESKFQVAKDFGDEYEIIATVSPAKDIIATSNVVVTVVLTTSLMFTFLMIILIVKRNYKRRHSKEVYDFREDEDVDESSLNHDPQEVKDRWDAEHQHASLGWQTEVKTTRNSCLDLISYLINLIKTMCNCKE